MSLDMEIAYNSDEERFFSYYLDELKQNGYIALYSYEPSKFRLFNGLNLDYNKALKTKNKLDTFQILTKRDYTPDFKIIWEKKAEGIFYNEIDCMLPREQRGYFVAQDGVSIIEIKPNFDKNNMTRLVKINIDWVYMLFGRYVQLVVPFPRVSKSGTCTPSNSLFTETFTPLKYLLTDKTKQRKKVNFKFRTLSEYISHLDCKK